jgi:hypothetical protein
MAFTPKVITPEPDPSFVRQLRKIDPDLRVVWGYERYFRNCWTIERRVPPERYFAMFASLLEADAPRFVQQPIYDENETVIGHREYDLAPEYEWVMNVVEPDGSRRELDQRTITELKRAYAWDRFHSITRAKIEKEREQEEADRAAKKKRIDAAMDALPDVWRETGKVLFGGQAETIMEGSEL